MGVSPTPDDPGARREITGRGRPQATGRRKLLLPPSQNPGSGVWGCPPHRGVRGVVPPGDILPRLREGAAGTEHGAPRGGVVPPGDILPRCGEGARRAPTIVIPEAGPKQ